MASARSPALLVQRPDVPGAGGARASRRSQGVRTRHSFVYRNQDLGQQRADPLDRGAGTPGRNRWRERSGARQAHHRRRHDGSCPRLVDSTMQSQFEHFAVTSMMGSPDRPPRADGALKFSPPWERIAVGVALALSRDGHFEWEDFRQHLIAAIGDWEARHEIDDPSWNYYDQWLDALEAVFWEAARRLGDPNAYEVQVMGTTAGAVCGTGNLRFLADSTIYDPDEPIDTL